MVSEVKVAIDRDTTGGTFTNHDIIRGNINLVVTTSLSLNYIQVKLEGISKSQVQVPREHLNPLPIQDSKKTKKKSKKEIRREREKKDKIIQDVHKVLYDTSVVFPPENVRKVLNAKEFTLTPGNYSYPFEFKIPMNSSCVKLQGLSNMLLFNSQTFDININNGNFNLSNLRGALLDGNGSSSGSPSSSDSYHITTQLPPSLSGMGDIANIRYFIKVTCKRSSILKPNLRSFDPFIFLPLDIDSQGRPINQNDNELREVYYRKELVFRNRNPEIVAVKIPVDQRKKELPSAPPLKGFFGKIFDSASPLPFISSNSPHILEKGRQSDVPFGFEIRFRHPAFLIPTKAPSFKLFLVSNQSPSKYSLAQYGRPDESNGLGVVYLQRLKMELLCTTTVSALEQEGSYKETHRSKFDKLIPICDNSYQNLIFDLKNSKRQKASSSTSSSSISQNTGYELEVPKNFMPIVSYLILFLLRLLRATSHEHILSRWWEDFLVKK